MYQDGPSTCSRAKQANGKWSPLACTGEPVHDEPSCSSRELKISELRPNAVPEFHRRRFEPDVHGADKFVVPPNEQRRTVAAAAVPAAPELLDESLGRCCCDSGLSRQPVSLLLVRVPGVLDN
jgi:hypothetical protein